MVYRVGSVVLTLDYVQPAGVGTNDGIDTFSEMIVRARAAPPAGCDVLISLGWAGPGWDGDLLPTDAHVARDDSRGGTTGRA